MPIGIKHLIECHCVLPQYRNTTKIIYHKFVAFSIIDDSDTTIPKYAQCNNCGVIHKIIDICRSEIIAGKDELKSLVSKDEIKIFLPKDVVEVLESYDVDLPTYENTKFIMENEMWGSHIVLSKDALIEESTGKILIFESDKKFRIDSFIARTTVTREIKNG